MVYPFSLIVMVRPLVIASTTPANRVFIASVSINATAFSFAIRTPLTNPSKAPIIKMIIIAIGIGTIPFLNIRIPVAADTAMIPTQERSMSPRRIVPARPIVITPITEACIGIFKYKLGFAIGLK